MNNWDDLLLTGGFPPRVRLRSGLALEHVGARPHSAPHSIFQELWHLTEWQTFVLQVVRSEAVLSDYSGDNFPEAPAPEDKLAWERLVREFMEGSEEPAVLAGDANALEVRLADGLTVREGLEQLAVHNAYHMGRIVLLRQLLGVWEPAPDDA